MSAPSLSFTCGAFTRVFLGLGYAAAVWAAVQAIERGQVESHAEIPRAAAAASASARIDLTATYAVSAWTVRVNGALVEAANSTATSWSADVSASNEIDVFVEAARGDLLAAEPAAVQVRVRTDAISRTESLWGTGAVSGNARVSLRSAP